MSRRTSARCSPRRSPGSTWRRASSSRCRPRRSRTPAKSSPSWSGASSNSRRGSGRSRSAVSLAVLHSRALAGLNAPEVTVEAHLANGLPSFTIVGLPDTEVKEAKDRVRAALQTARFAFPARRITVNLAPADLPKESGRFDLPIALGILAATGQVPDDKFGELEFAGELSLAGELRPVRGALALALALRRQGADRTLVLP